MRRVSKDFDWRVFCVSCNNRFCCAQDPEFMLDRDAFVRFSFTFDPVLQFHAQRQEPCDGEGSSQLQVCSS